MTHGARGGKMTKWVCFLHGINVGGHRKIPMADLRQLIADIALDLKVRTYIASGNAVFSADSDKNTLQKGLREGIRGRFGFDVPVLLLSADDIRDVLASCPCPDEKGNLAHAFLCFDEPQMDHVGVTTLRIRSESVTIAGRTVWLHAPEGIGRSKLAAKMEQLIGVEVTARNLNTVRKMVEMVL